MNDIYKTFEQFFALPISIIQKRIIQIMHVETNIFANATQISVEELDRRTQVTVIGSKKVYNLLTTVLQKRKMLQHDNNKSEIYS